MTGVVTKTYDALGSDYAGNTHRTTQFLYALQDSFLNAALQSVQARRENTKPLGAMDVLVVGAGSTGNARQVTGVVNERAGVDNTSLNPDRITYLDLSKGALDALIESYADTMSRSGGIRIPGTFVQGDALELSMLFGGARFDVILGGLCDHILPWQQFFEEVQHSLKENGAFICTYPARGIFEVIRREIYGIPIDKTRFRVGDSQYVLDSLALDTEQLAAMLHTAGFKTTVISDIMYSPDDESSWVTQVSHPSQTILEAAQRIRKPLEDIPILVGGVGLK